MAVRKINEISLTDNEKISWLRDEQKVYKNNNFVTVFIEQSIYNVIERSKKLILILRVILLLRLYRKSN